MSQLAEFIHRYVSIWNERDAGARRRSIAALWAPDGATCYSQLDSRGYDAIEARVAGAHEKWVRDQGFVFRPRKSIVSHHNVLRFYWEMVPAGGGEVAAAGLIILILGPDGRIHSDYQFSEPPAPPPRELSDIVERYVAFWNEGDADRRRGRLAELWAEDATFLSATVERRGSAGIEAEALDTYAAYGARGFVFRSANVTDGHHDAVRMGWEMRPKDGGEMAAAGLALLLLNEEGRIRRDYQFDAA
jgi:hypothetical protein